MALKNAFDNLGTESALRRIANLLNFARTSADQIRTVVDSGTLTVYNRNTSTSPANNDGSTYYGSSTWNVIDSRDPLRQQLRTNAIYVRQTRWTIN